MFGKIESISKEIESNLRQLRIHIYHSDTNMESNGTCTFSKGMTCHLGKNWIYVDLCYATESTQSKSYKS